MSSDDSIQRVGIEKARTELGPLANRVNATGRPAILTRNGKPLVALIPAPGTDAAEQAFCFDPAGYSDDTKQLLAALVEATIAVEYARGKPEERAAFEAAAHARRAARNAVQEDLRPTRIDMFGDDRFLTGYADSTVAIDLYRGLEARRCQSPTNPTCTGHFEADVPPVDGRKLCSECYCQLPDDAVTA